MPYHDVCSASLYSHLPTGKSVFGFVVRQIMHQAYNAHLLWSHFNGSKARGRVFLYGIDTRQAWESTPTGSACHILCVLTTKPHECFQSFRLYCSFLSNTPAGTFSFSRRAESPFAFFVCARLLCRRTAFRIFAAVSPRVFHATQKSCTVRSGTASFSDRPRRRLSQETRMR